MSRGLFSMVALGLLGCGADPETETDTTNPGLVLQLDASRVRVQIEQTATVPITVSGGIGSVDVVLDGLPEGVTAAPVTLAEGETTTGVTITASATADMAGPLPIGVVITDADGRTEREDLPLFVAGPPGSFDTSLSFDGQATFRPTTREYDATRDLALDGEGRAVVAGVGQGTDPWRGWVTRFLIDGEIDTTFADGGVLEDFGDESSVSGVEVVDGNALRLLGTWTEPGGPYTPGLRAVTEDGATDPGYGNGGWVTLDAARNLFPAPDGLVVLASGELTLVDATGEVDRGFVSGSTLVTLTVAADPAGRLLVAGLSDGTDYAAQRLFADGGLDTSFGNSGTLSVPISPFKGDNALVRDLRSVPSGGLAVGSSNVGSGNENVPQLLRFDTNGAVDRGFGDGGLSLVLERGERGGASHVRELPDGSMLVLGYLRIDSLLATPLAMRFRPDGSVDTSFGDAGRVELPSFPKDIEIDEAGGRAWILGDGESGGGGILLSRIWL